MKVSILLKPFEVAQIEGKSNLALKEQQKESLKEIKESPDKKESYSEYDIIQHSIDLLA